MQTISTPQTTIPHEYLSEKERILLQLIREDSPQKVVIHFKRGEISSLEVLKTHPPETRFKDLLHESDYQSLHIVNHQGQIAKIEQTTKILL